MARAPAALKRQWQERGQGKREARSATSTNKNMLVQTFRRDTEDTLSSTMFVSLWDGCARTAMRISNFNTPRNRYKKKNHVGKAGASKTSKSAKQGKAKKQEMSMKSSRQVQSEESQTHQASQANQNCRTSTQNKIANRSHC